MQFWSLGRPELLNVSTARQRSTLTPRHQTPPNPSQTPDSARSHHIFTVGAASGDGIPAAEPLLTRLNGCFEASSLPCSSLHACAWWDILQTDGWHFYPEGAISDTAGSVWPHTFYVQLKNTENILSWHEGRAQNPNHSIWLPFNQDHNRYCTEMGQKLAVKPASVFFIIMKALQMCTSSNNPCKGSSKNTVF